MGRLIFTRIWQALVSLLGVTFVIFLLVRATGDPKQMLVPDEMPLEDQEKLIQALGLDRPWYVQYGTYVSGLVKGDMGISRKKRLPVREVMLQRLPNTLKLGGVSIVISLSIALPLGIYAGYYRGRWVDFLARMFAILGQSAPGFWVGILLILLFAVHWRILPPAGMGSPAHFIMPAITLGWAFSSGLLRITRSSILEVLDTEYIKLTRVKGLSETTLLWKHALRNAAIPILTYGGLALVALLTGSVIAETVFAWPGVGSLMVQGVADRDVPLVQGIILLFSAMYITSNLLVDVAYIYLNPRLRRR